MKALKEISNILTACGCNPDATKTENGGYVKVNAPAVEKSCDLCAKRNSCSKTIGVIWGFCNADFEPTEEG